MNLPSITAPVATPTPPSSVAAVAAPVADTRRSALSSDIQPYYFADIPDHAAAVAEIRRRTLVPGYYSILRPASIGGYAVSWIDTRTNRTGEGEGRTPLSTPAAVQSDFNAHRAEYLSPLLPQDPRTLMRSLSPEESLLFQLRYRPDISSREQAATQLASRSYYYIFYYSTSERRWIRSAHEYHGVQHTPIDTFLQLREDVFQNRRDERNYLDYLPSPGFSADMMALYELERQGMVSISAGPYEARAETPHELSRRCPPWIAVSSDNISILANNPCIQAAKNVLLNFFGGLFVSSSQEASITEEILHATSQAVQAALKADPQRCLQILRRARAMPQAQVAEVVAGLRTALAWTGPCATAVATQNSLRRILTASPNTFASLQTALS